MQIKSPFSRSNSSWFLMELKQKVETTQLLHRVVTLCLSSRGGAVFTGQWCHISTCVALGISPGVMWHHSVPPPGSSDHLSVANYLRLPLNAPQTLHGRKYEQKVTVAFSCQSQREILGTRVRGQLPLITTRSHQIGLEKLQRPGVLKGANPGPGLIRPVSEQLDPQLERSCPLSPVQRGSLWTEWAAASQQLHHTHVLTSWRLAQHVVPLLVPWTCSCNKPLFSICCMCHSCTCCCDEVGGVYCERWFRPFLNFFSSLFRSEVQGRSSVSTDAATSGCVFINVMRARYHSCSCYISSLFTFLHVVMVSTRNDWDETRRTEKTQMGQETRPHLLDSSSKQSPAFWSPHKFRVGSIPPPRWGSLLLTSCLHLVCFLC